MGGLEMNIYLPRRRAEVYVDDYYAKRFNIEKGTYPCHVQGLFQHIDGDEAYPVYVCELDNGHVLSQFVSEVKFVDTIKGVLK